MSTADQLTALNAGYASIGALIPNKYNFTDELNTSQVTINDGGNDMYDGANVLNTNRTNAYSTVRVGGYGSRLATSIPYTHTKHSNTVFSFNGNGTVNNGATYFGTGSDYFTNLYPGFFVLVANNISITEFSVTGNIGVDGGGTLSTHDFSLTIGGNTYSVYRKMIGGTTDPSINHFMIIPGNGTGVTHTWDTTKQWDDNVIQGLTGVSSLYYILAARSSGQVISNTDATNIVTTFVQTLGNIVVNSSQTISASSISSSESFNSNIVKRKLNLTSSISSSESFNSNIVKQKLNLNSIVSSETFNSNIVKIKLNLVSSISSSESFNSNIVKQKLNLTSIISSESFNSNIVKQKLNLTSIISSESFGSNSIKHTIILPSSIGSSESFNSNIVKQKLNLNSIFDEDFGIIKLNQNVVVNSSIGSLENFSVPSVKLTITNSDLINIQNFGVNKLLQNVTFLETSSIPSKENFEIPNISQYIFVTEAPFCQTKANYLDCFDYKHSSAIVPAITIVRQKLYLKNKMPIPERNRKGFYIKIN